MNRWVMLVGVLLGSGCAESALCVPGQAIACAGSGGCAGGQVCSEDGASYGECVCSAADAGPVDGGRERVDAGPRSCDYSSECTQPNACIGGVCQPCTRLNCAGTCNGVTGFCTVLDGG